MDDTAGFSAESAVVPVGKWRVEAAAIAGEDFMRRFRIAFLGFLVGCGAFCIANVSAAHDDYEMHGRRYDRGRIIAMELGAIVIRVDQGEHRDLKFRVVPETRIRTSGTEGRILSEVILRHDQDVGIDSVDGVAEVINIHLHGDVAVELAKLVEEDRRWHEHDHEREHDRKLDSKWHEGYRDYVTRRDEHHEHDERDWSYDFDEKWRHEHSSVAHDGYADGHEEHKSSERGAEAEHLKQSTPVPRDVTPEDGTYVDILQMPWLREAPIVSCRREYQPPGSTNYC